MKTSDSLDCGEVACGWVGMSLMYEEFKMLQLGGVPEVTSLWVG